MAVAPAPVYTTGMEIGAGGACPESVGTAVICTGPPLKTISFAAFRYARSSIMSSPVVGAPASSRTLSSSAISFLSAGKTMVVSSAVVPSECRSTTCTRLNATRSATPACWRSDGKMALNRRPLAYRMPDSRGAVGSLTQLSSTASTTVAPKAIRRTADRSMSRGRAGVRLLIGAMGLGYHQMATVLPSSIAARDCLDKMVRAHKRIDMAKGCRSSVSHVTYFAKTAQR